MHKVHRPLSSSLSAPSKAKKPYLRNPTINEAKAAMASTISSPTTRHKSIVEQLIEIQGDIHTILFF
jgi:hypothetical protein